MCHSFVTTPPPGESSRRCDCDGHRPDTLERELTPPPTHAAGAYEFGIGKLDHLESEAPHDAYFRSQLADFNDLETLLRGAPFQS